MKRSESSLENVGKNGVIKLHDLDDKTLLNFCKSGKSANSLCRETYFKNRTMNRYPETVVFKNQQITWRQHYLEIVYYVDLLKRKYNCDYQKKDQNPKLLYHSKKSIF